MHHRSLRALQSAGATAGLALAATLATPAHALQVFACEPEWAALTRELAGDKATVYTATPDLRQVSSTDARAVFDGPSANFDALRDELAACAALPQGLRPERAVELAARHPNAPPVTLQAGEDLQALPLDPARLRLLLRNLQSQTRDPNVFPNFDDNLRQSMRRETELLCETVFREDRPVTELISADYTFLDERLARHYGVPHVFGSHFRRVSFADQPARQRGGLLRQSSILTVTSYATRTSPVIRGHWILANLIGAPPPPPPSASSSRPGCTSRPAPARRSQALSPALSGRSPPRSRSR